MATPPTLEQLLHDSRTHTFMLEFLQKRQAEMLLMFWADCEQFKQLMGRTSEIATQAKKIVDIHFGPKSRTSDMVGQVETQRVLDQFKRGRPTLDMFASAQRECVRQLRSNHFPAFLESKSYREMFQANVDIKNWTLLDVLRDPKRVRALNLLLLVERPEFVETLRFVLDLRNRYKPLIAEGLLPVMDGPATGGTRSGQTKTPQKLHIVKELIDLGKFLEKKYLSVDSKQFAKGVSGPTAARVRNSLEECAHRLENATQSSSQNIGATAASQASAATRWVRAGALGGSGSSSSTTAAPAAGPSIAVLDDTVKLLAEAFKQAEEEALGWLEKYAMADARRTDYFLTPVVEPPSPNKPIYMEEAPGHESILVLRMTEQEITWRLCGPHRLWDRDLQLKEFARNPVTHLVVMEPTYVPSKSREELASVASDRTGATVSAISRGLKFRTKIVEHYTFGQYDGVLNERNGSTSGSFIEDESSPIQQNAKVTSLAGVSQQEAAAENAARLKSQSAFDSSTLSNTELHAHCFPLHLGVEVDPIVFANEADCQTIFHYFCLPCKATRHSFEYGCSCVFAVCMTNVTKRPILVPVSTKKEAPAADVSIMSVESGGSFGVARSRSKSPRNQHYSETALALQKVPNFGLGLNLALNRDGSVEVTRFVSDVQTSSPAAASGKIAVEDELLFVNRVSVHGRRFDDIVGQIKNSSSPVYLRFARGNYIESILLKASSLSGESDHLVEVPSPTGEGTEEMIKLTLLSPKVVCITSSQPIFEAMHSALENAWSSESSNDETSTIGELATKVASSLRFSNKLTWRVDVRASLFNLLDVPHVVDVLSALLLERRILVVSDHPERVAPAVMALLQMVRPFSWRHDFSAFLPEAHYDWFASRIGMNKPYLVGICTVDVVSPPIDQFIPRRQGRLTLREEVWSSRERDFLMPSERLVRNAGHVRNAISMFTSPDTLIVDLDAERLSGNQSMLQKDRFPADIRETLVSDINLALGRGGIARWGATTSEKPSGMDVSKKVNAALIKAYTSLTLHRCGEYAISLRDGAVGFYRGAFLGALKNESHLEYLEKFTKTESFKEFVTSNWDLSPEISK